MNKTISFDDWEAQQLQNTEFQAAASELERAYQVARLRILVERVKIRASSHIFDIPSLVERIAAPNNATKPSSDAAPAK